MIASGELRVLAQGRLGDAEALFSAGRFDGAVYLCGYSLELQLKARICQTLNWPEFPSTGSEFAGISSFKTHDLDVLLRLSGVESMIRTGHLVAWSAAAGWEPEMRYRPIGTASQAEAQSIIEAVKALVGVL